METGRKVSRTKGDWKESVVDKYRVEGKCRGQMESGRKVSRTNVEWKVSDEENGKEEEVWREKDS
jgi:hypothetical protein